MRLFSDFLIFISSPDIPDMDLGHSLINNAYEYGRYGVISDTINIINYILYTLIKKNNNSFYK